MLALRKHAGTTTAGSRRDANRGDATERIGREPGAKTREVRAKMLGEGPCRLDGRSDHLMDRLGGPVGHPTDRRDAMRTAVRIPPIAARRR
jgi:hypothetical protein